MIQGIERLVFYSALLSVISQFGKHFWPAFSFVSGIRIDYLSPTLHLSDILILALFTLFVIRKGATFFRPFQNIYLALFILVVSISSLFAVSPGASLFGMIKLFEFIFLGFYIANQFEERDIIPTVRIFVIGAIIVSLIAILQFSLQSSIGGVFYFLGERTFNASTVGIATFLYNGQEILRPYATFPHPNVLALYLLSTIVFISYLLKSKFTKLLIAVFSIALLLTFSRIIIFLLVLFAVYSIYHKSRKSRKWPTILFLGAITVYGTIFFERFFKAPLLLRDALFRVDLLSIGWDLFIRFPLLGVGINNFFIYEISYQKTLTATLLQPIHNIYLYILVNIGIFGLGLALWFFVKTVLRVWDKVRTVKGKEKNFFEAVFVVLISILFVGMFDHFPLTVQQGQLMFAILLGLAWTRVRK